MQENTDTIKEKNIQKPNIKATKVQKISLEEQFKNMTDNEKSFLNYCKSKLILVDELELFRIIFKKNLIWLINTICELEICSNIRTHTLNIICCKFKHLKDQELKTKLSDENFYNEVHIVVKNLSKDDIERAKKATEAKNKKRELIALLNKMPQDQKLVLNYYYSKFCRVDKLTLFEELFIKDRFWAVKLLCEKLQDLSKCHWIWFKSACHKMSIIGEEEINNLLSKNDNLYEIIASKKEAANLQASKDLAH